MNVRSTWFRLFVVSSFLILTGGALAEDHLSARGLPELRDVEHGAFVVKEVNGKVTCRDATVDEARQINRPRTVPVHVFGEETSNIRANATGGLDIVLRSTAQLDGNPQVKQAFEHAAEIWESKISNPVTVYVDVDYGTTFFGEPFSDPGIIAATSSASYFFNVSSYPLARTLLVARADNPAETAIYNALPATTVPTDLGANSRFGATATLLRALGHPQFPAAAQQSDDAPKIAFNSAFQYDFDPSDGISPGKKDFEGVVVHELGHMLGFVSRVGASEVGSTDGPSILDLFRFRPGVSAGTFGTENRILTTGGDQVYFAGAESLGLSTGNAQAQNGDSRQASHWKDDALTGTRIGIMDPTLSSGKRSEITDADIAAFNTIGWNMDGGSGCGESEPNETTDTADDLGLPGSCSGNAASGDASTYVRHYNNGDDAIEDVFKVNLASPAKIEVTVTFPAGDLDVFLFTVSGSTLNILGESNSTANGGTEHFVTSSTLSPGTYYVGVSAFSGSGNYSITTNTVGGVVITPPSNLQASATSSSVIRLTWQDNSSNEDDFRVERNIGGTWTDIGAASANATSINITGFTAGQTGTFRLRARAGSNYSGYSNEASATTPGTIGPCVANATTVCLLSNRFQVSINYRNQFSNPPGQTGDFLTARLLSTPGVNPDTGLFGFSSAQAVEVVVRIQDARPFAPRFDVYYGGMTDVEYTVTVTDTQTGTSRQYHNPPGTVGGGVDRTSFPAN